MSPAVAVTVLVAPQKLLTARRHATPADTRQDDEALVTLKVRRNDHARVGIGIAARRCDLFGGQNQFNHNAGVGEVENRRR